MSIAEELGLYAIVRPSPYICAEWEFGGFPAWLLNEGTRIRTNETVYLNHVADYYDVLIKKNRAASADKWWKYFNDSN